MRPFARIADRIKHFRSMRKKTQVSLAKDASIDYRHFQKLEAGQSDFKVSTIIKLSDALAIPPCFLLQTNPFDDEQQKKDGVCANEMLSQLTVGVVAWNLTGNIIFCNRTFAGILGMEDEVEALRAYDMRGLMPAKDIPNQQLDYQKSIREGRIKSDFVRVQIQTPKTNALKVVWAYWNQVQCGKKGDQKGYVAAVWEEGDFRDLSVLPAPSPRAI